MKGFIEAVVLIIVAVAVALVMGQQSGDTCNLNSTMTTYLTFSATCACAVGRCNQTASADSIGYCAQQIFGNTSCINDLMNNINGTCGDADVATCCNASSQYNVMPSMAAFFNCYSNAINMC